MRMAKAEGKELFWKECAGAAARTTDSAEIMIAPEFRFIVPLAASPVGPVPPDETPIHTAPTPIVKRTAPQIWQEKGLSPV